MNRATDRDSVAVRLLVREEWSAPSDKFEENTSAASLVAGGPASEDTAAERAVVQAAKESGGRGKGVLPSAAVVAIIKRNWRPYCGTLLPPVGGVSSNRALFVPDCRHIPRVRITTRQAEALQGMRIVVTLDGWAADSKYPVGHYVKTLGKVGDPEVETEVVLIEHGVAYEPFADGCNAELPDPKTCVALSGAIIAMTLPCPRPTAMVVCDAALSV